MKWLIRSLFFTLLITIIAAVAAAVLILTIDINRLKPVIQSQLAKQGVNAEFSGDLGWSIYPALAITANQLSLNHVQNNQPIAQIGHAAFSVELLPLLGKEVEINQILLSNSELWYRANTLALLSEYSGVDKQPTTSANTNPPDLKIKAEQFMIKGLIANVEQEGAGTSQFTVDTLTAYNLNLEGQPFPLNLKAHAQLPDLPTINQSLSATLSLALAKQHLAIDSLESTTLFRESAASSPQGEIHLSLSKGALEWGDALTLSAPIELYTANVRALLTAFGIAIDTSDPDVLSAFNLSVNTQLKENTLTLDTLAVSLDQTQLTGQSKIVLDRTGSLPPVEANLTINQINIDRYLPAPSEPSTAAPLNPPPTALPLELLQDITTQVNVSIGTLTAMGINITDITMHAQARDGDLLIEPLKAQIFDGSITANTQAKAGIEKLNVNGKVSTNDINLQKALIHFADFKNIEGLANSTITIHTQGRTDKDLTNNLAANAQATIPSLTFSPFNLEQQYCDTIAWIEEKQGNNAVKQALESKQWQPYTKLTPVQLSANLAGNTVQVDNLSADIEEIQASAKGSFDIATGNFTFPIDLSLANFSNAPDSCGMIDKKWRELALPLLCKGSLDAIGPKTCLPDTKRINKIIEAKVEAKIEEAKEKAKAEVDKKVEEEKRKLQEQADKKINEALKDLKNDEKAKELEDKLKNIFGKGNK